MDEWTDDGRNVGTFREERTLSGAVAVQEGDLPTVYLGVEVEIRVDDDGRAGTKNSWGSLTIGRYPHHEIYGIDYTFFRS